MMCHNEEDRRNRRRRHDNQHNPHNLVELCCGPVCGRIVIMTAHSLLLPLVVVVLLLLLTSSHSLASPLCRDCVLVRTGSPTQSGGPIGTDFDSPFTAARLPNGTVVGFSANQKTYLVTRGSSVTDVLPTPVFTGLEGNASNPDRLDHCGAWLNTVIEVDGLLMGFYHEEWRCDYARNSYTNKSVAVAISEDGGMSWTKPNCAFV